MARYFIGMDGSASKTHVALYDRQTGMMDLLKAPGSNYQMLPQGLHTFYEIIVAATKEILSRNDINIEAIAAAGFGMAGMDSPRQHDLLSQVFREIGYQQFSLGNDSVMGIKGFTLSGVGIAAVNGSGFSVISMDKEGETVQTGGLGRYTGDKGGGGYYFEEVVAAVFEELYKGSKQTALTAPMLALFQATERIRFVEQLALLLDDAAAKKKMYTPVSILLHEAAEAGDETALSILEKSGQTYARAIYHAAKGLPSLFLQAEIEVGLVGSNFTKCESEKVISTIKEQLAKTDKQFRLQIADAPPVAGGVLWAMETAGIEVTAEEKYEIRRALAER